MNSVPLRQYQQRAVEATRAAAVGGARAIVIVAPTGAGKTRIGAEFVRLSTIRGRCVLWLAHRSELLEQASARLQAEGVQCGIIAPWASPSSAPVQVASVQTLLARGELPKADLVVADECVTGDTLLGARRASRVQIGDCVPTPWGDRAVLRVWKRRSRDLVRITTESGNRLTCTGNHYVWTQRGFLPAKEITTDDYACPANHDVPLPLLWADVRDCTRHMASTGAQRRAEHVPRMQAGARTPGVVGNHGADEPCACQPQDASEQPDGTPRNPGEGCAHTARHEPQATGAGRQRPRADASTSCATACSRGWVGGGVHRAHRQSRRDPCALQVGSRQPGNDDSCRGGRGEPLCPCQEGAGRAQGCVAALSRLDRVSRVERRSAGAVEVYDFEVDGAHCYFANGILTHNCHHHVATEWTRVVSHYRQQGVFLLGLTATPERADGVALGNVFDHLVSVAQPRELIELGHLVPVDVWAPPKPVDGALGAPVIRSWLEHAAGKRTIVFGSNVAHAQQIAVQLCAAGYTAECVDGDLPHDQRQAAVARFARGETTVLTNVFVLTEGFDVPAVDCVVLARGFSAMSTYIQAVGRGMRPSAGKGRLLVLDLKGAVHQHGLPDEDRFYSLTGKAIKRAERIEPIRQCRRCGAVFAAAGKACPRCGAYVPRPPTPEEKQARLDRIRSVATVEEKRSYLGRMQAVARSRGYSSGWVAHRFKAMYGHFPDQRLWRAA